VTLKRLPTIAFGVLVLATVAAFFLVYVVKVGNPLVWGTPKPTPAAIDPVHGRVGACVSSTGQRLDYRQAQIGIAVSRADSVGVYIVNNASASAAPVATISAGTPMQKSVLGTADWHPANFTWHGHVYGGVFAPDGTYFFRIVLQHQGTSITLSGPGQAVQVIRTPPRARVTRVEVVGDTKRASGPALLSPPGKLRIDFTPAPKGAAYRRVWIDVYRTDVAGRPRLVTQIPANGRGHTATWNGEVRGRPAAAGTYLVGITSQNPACDQANWPTVLPPAHGTTPHAGVTIRYLTVTPPLTPTVSGSHASVTVYSPAAGFTWKLRVAGTAKVLAHGSGAAGDTQIEVRMPRRQAGLYTLTVHAGSHTATAPLVASKAGRAASRARVLVVLPMLSWVGDTPVDDSGDGVPDTLKLGDAVSLDRPLVDGPPASLGDDAALLAYLNSRHLAYQLTTDVALAEGTGPSLVDRWGLLFPDGENFLPSPLDSLLPEYVRHGLRVLTLGAGTFEGTSKITGYPSDPQAGAPVRMQTDPFGAVRGPLSSTGGALITELADDLHLLGGLVAFTGFSSYQPIEPPAGVHVSAAGIANGSPAIIAFPVGSGVVVEVGLPNFGDSLTGNVDSQELMGDVWRVLAKR
jgi:hypothetical protein